MEKSIANHIFNLGIEGSGIGIFWIKKHDGHYYYHHTESSSEIYGLEIKDLPVSILYGEKWKETFEKIIKINSAHKNVIESSQKQMYQVLQGEISACKYKAPWLDNSGNVIWLMDQLYIVDRDIDNTAQTVIGLTVNQTLRSNEKEKFEEMEEITVKLRSANQRAIELANLLVWSMNYEEFPKGDYIFCNDAYALALGLQKNINGYVSFEDFMKTRYLDLEGARSMQSLLDQVEATKLNKTDEIINVLVKHKNILTKEPVYLNHFTKVDERFDDGSIRRIAGYIIDITERVRMEKDNEALDKMNKELLVAQKLAVKSGKVLIWYQNSEESDNDNYFYGNEILFQKLGIRKFRDSRFFIQDFNRTIYTEDVEGKNLSEAYFEIDDLVEMNQLDSYTKTLLKHKNLTTGEILYMEHNLIVEERYENGSLKIRGGYMNDVTNETNYKKRIEFLVKHDLVTGLNNRNMFEEYKVSSELPNSYTLIVFDIDGLKFINDAFGHLEGDKVIKFLGDELKKEFGRDSKSFRIGGDEFSVISEDIDPESIEKRLDKVKVSLKEISNQQNLSFSISVGYEIVTNRDIRFNLAFTTAENIMYRRKLGDRNSRKSKTMETVLETLNTKTEETKAHCDRLGKYAELVLIELGYSRVSDLEDIKLLCQVHDIGKITISEDILSKPGKLTDEEMDKIKSHSEAGYKIIKNIVESDTIANGVLYHHEKYDGTGYPFGLKGGEIPLFAKIVSVCDSYDVMITGRPYQKTKTKVEAIKEIERCKGTQFDPIIADAFISAIQKND